MTKLRTVSILAATIATCMTYYTARVEAASCTAGEAACEAATVFTVLSGAKYCCLNSTSIRGASKTVNGVTTTTCECGDEVPPGGEESTCLMGDEQCADASFTTILNGTKYCCENSGDNLSSKSINGAVTCNCTSSSLTVPPEPEVPDTGFNCCEGDQACKDATTRATVNGKTFCCPGGGSVLARNINGNEFCTCFEKQQDTCAFTNVLDGSVVDIPSSTSVQQLGVAAVSMSAATVASLFVV